MARLPDVPVQPQQLQAAFEAFSLTGDPLKEYRRWLLSALHDECVRRRREALLADAYADVNRQIEAFAAELPPRDDTGDAA